MLSQRFAGVLFIQFFLFSPPLQFLDTINYLKKVLFNEKVKTLKSFYPPYFLSLNPEKIHLSLKI